MRVFPIPRAHRYGYGPGFKPPDHLGVDIFAPEGTPVVAVEDGLAYSRIEPKGGNAAYLEGDDGVIYYYGHLKAWDLKIIRGGKQPVKAGDPIGFVGTTGNAQGTEPHLHFQMRRGSTVENPYPHLVDIDPGQGSLEKPPESGKGKGVGLLLLALAFKSGGSSRSNKKLLPLLCLLAKRKT